VKNRFQSLPFKRNLQRYNNVVKSASPYPREQRDDATDV
jgi:hypothetical protein